MQATDEYMAVRNARVVLVDDTGVRATMTASWLIQLGWPEVWVLRDGLDRSELERGTPARTPLGYQEAPMLAPRWVRASTEMVSPMPTVASAVMPSASQKKGSSKARG